jgi:hypothetical protein
MAKAASDCLTGEMRHVAACRRRNQPMYRDATHVIAD